MTGSISFILGSRGFDDQIGKNWARGQKSSNNEKSCVIHDISAFLYKLKNGISRERLELSHRGSYAEQSGTIHEGVSKLLAY